VGWARDPHPLPQFRRNNGTIFAGLEIAGLFQ